MREMRKMSDRVGLVTADEFAQIPDDDCRHELVAGRVIRMSPVGSLHGVLVVRLAGLLDGWVRRYDLGLVMTETGFRLADNPDTVRAPDLSFVARARVPATGAPRGFWQGPPDLAVEVLSPDDHPATVRAKVDEYLACGVRLVWVVDPDATTVTSHRRGAGPDVTGRHGTLSGADVVEGFEIALRLDALSGPNPYE
jgi:Uma2 family endonuclease